MNYKDSIRLNRVYIIAEIGGNFLTFEEAKTMIDAAKACGADAVKLQTYRADTLASRTAMFAFETTGATSQYDMFKNMRSTRIFTGRFSIMRGKTTWKSSQRRLI